MDRRAGYDFSGAVLLLAICLFASVKARAHGEDDPLLVMALIDQLELQNAHRDSSLAWDMQGWIGKDVNKLWIKTDGERVGGDSEDAELQFLYSKAVAPYWDFQVGVRHDFEPSPSRSWAAIGFQGLAPYFFETDATLFIGDSGRTALRLQAEYDLLLTQRLILTPEIEVNLYGQDDPAIGIGSGLSDIEAGLRLRYEIRREFAPYIGVIWQRDFGGTADFVRAVGGNASDTRFVLGMRAWFKDCSANFLDGENDENSITRVAYSFVRIDYRSINFTIHPGPGR